MIRTKRKTDIKKALKAELEGFVVFVKNNFLNLFLYLIIILYWVMKLSTRNTILCGVLSVLVLWILPYNSNLISKYMVEDESKYYFQIMGLVTFNVVSYIFIGILFLLLFF